VLAYIVVSVVGMNNVVGVVAVGKDVVGNFVNWDMGWDVNLNRLESGSDHVGVVEDNGSCGEDWGVEFLIFE